MLTLKFFRDVKQKALVETNKRKCRVTGNFMSADSDLKEKLKGACNKNPDFVISVAKERKSLKRKYDEDIEEMKDLEDETIVNYLNKALINKRIKLADEEPSYEVSEKMLDEAEKMIQEPSTIEITSDSEEEDSAWSEFDKVFNESIKSKT